MTSNGMSTAKDYLKAANTVSDPLTQSALLYLSATALEKSQCKLSKTSAQANSTGNLRHSFKGNRLWTNLSETDSEATRQQIPRGRYSSSSVVRDILAMESKIAELGKGAGIQSGVGNSQLEFDASKSQLLSSFISTKQLVESSSTGNTGRSIVDNKPSVLGESYMFLSKGNMLPQMQAEKLTPSVRSEKQSTVSNGSSYSRYTPTAKHSDQSRDSSVDNLLGTMVRLEHENSQLTARINELLDMERKSMVKLRQVEEFKSEFAAKYERLKAVLVSYAKKYPHPSNPVVQGQEESKVTVKDGMKSISEKSVGITDVSKSVSGNSATVGNSDDSSTKPVDPQIVQQLEQTLRGALARVSKLQKQVGEKDRVIAEYESYYRRKQAEKQKQRELQMGIRKTPGMNINTQPIGSPNKTNIAEGSPGRRVASMDSKTLKNSRPSSDGLSGSAPGSTSGAVPYVNPAAGGSTGPRKHSSTATFEASLHRNQSS